MGVDGMMRGMTSHKISVDSLGASLEETGEKAEDSNVSYLTIPNPTAPRRPSTADIFIEKLKVEKVEGGGLSIQGVSLASNCHVTLCVFGTFFLVAGLILSYVSFSVMSPEEKEERDRILAGGTAPPNPRKNASSVTQMRKIGPAFICIGLLMLILGISFYALAKKISRDDLAQRKIISQRHLSQLADSFRHRGTSPMHTIAPAPHEQYPILSVRRNSWWVDPTPVEEPISVDGKEIAIQCPSPLGDIQGLISPPPVSPVPSECGAEPYSDIACFPHPPVTKTNSDPSMHSSASHHGRDANSAHVGGHSQPSSASTHGRSHSGSASTVPFIQVTAAQTSFSSANIIQLPRLSRHCSNRTDSRPTTAETR
ncbi:uncharacterized protein LOC135216784 isoform X2 [Macrobrachium nipponense]|uniref:uncharacterized protein LOC135216784 isoform X2 n=1 Tax=Macrobrachium nipponense TaxID=159736 RepID=UPI0030C809E0